MPTTELVLRAIPNIPSIQPGDDLVTIILNAMNAVDLSLQGGDVLVISSKIVSKSENRFVDLRTISPSPRAVAVAEMVKKDPRYVELVLRESDDISRLAPNILIVRHKLGFTSANAGIDQSNTGFPKDDIVLLLPENPDDSATQLAAQFEKLTNIRPAIVISDTHGRPFRNGNLNVAIGIDGLPPLLDQRGQTDLYGRTLVATVTAFADQVASAAGLVTGEADEGQPVVLVRGLIWPADQIGAAKAINRLLETDLYR